MYVTVNGTQLYFDVEGAGLVPDGLTMRERPVVLLLHGGPGLDHTLFKPYLSALADTAQIIYLDHRGQGRSGRPPLETCTMEQMADDAAAFCRTLGITRPVVLGHSFGGFVALQLAVRHPDLAARLILVDTAASSADMSEAPILLEQRYGVEAARAAGRFFSGDVTEATVADFARLVMPTYLRDPAKAHLFAEGMARTIVNPELMAFYFGQSAGSYDLRPRLREIRVPALVVVGDYDWLLPPSASRAIAAGIPDAELVVIPASGHLPMLEQPEAFAAAVRRFLTAPVPAGVGGI